MLRCRPIPVAVAGLSLLLLTANCKKKVPVPPPPPPPKAEVKEVPPPKPEPPKINRFAAEPSTIERGQSATLRWSVSNATSVSLDQTIGTVQAEGTRQVYPTQATTYRLRAEGPGGSASATTAVNVTVPPPPPPPAPPPAKKLLSERLTLEVQDAYFDYDKSNIRPDATTILTSDGQALKSILSDFPSASVAIEGHCDERGSAEYNLALGDRRAASAKDFLVQLGVPESRLKTKSYGKERPQCTESNEDCWQKNRRVHVVPGE